MTEGLSVVKVWRGVEGAAPYKVAMSAMLAVILSGAKNLRLPCVKGAVTK